MSAPARSAFLALLLGVALVVTTAGLAAPPVGTAGAQATSADERMPVGTTQITIELTAAADARWTVTTRLPVRTDAEQAAFRELAEPYVENPERAPWVRTVRAAQEQASTATGRSMAITGVQASTNASTGRISVGLTWTNFARSMEDRYVVDDVFNTTSGTWLDSLTADQVLIMELPDGFGVVSAPEGAVVQNRQVRWTGPTQFEAGQMRLVYSGDAGGVFSGGLPVGTFGLLIALVLLAAVGVVAVRRRRGVGPAAADPAATADAPAETDPPAESRSAEESAAPSDSGTEPVADSVDTELLSDEERVERLLEENGGRMKQATIVTETQWSNAKVSQLLSSMEEDGRIDKLRIGRENLISFPEEDVADIDDS
jgi:hypothetical protein